MLRVRTLGVSEIIIDGARLGPEQPTAFALVFLLAVRTTSTSRRELAELLWPNASDADRKHRFRSLLHRLRRIGMPIRCDGPDVGLSTSAVLDFRDFATLPHAVDEVQLRLSGVGAVLPNLIASSSGSLADRLDDERDIILAIVSRWLSAALTMAKRIGDWPVVEQIEPLNEEAWLALAEAKCLTSSNACALATLDEYRARLGEQEPTAARLLRQRIAEQAMVHENATDEPPFVGRGETMRRIWSSLVEAGAGHGTALMLWGPPGIGKTRILREVVRAAPVASIRAVWIDASPLHGLGEQAFTRTLVTRLLDERGAAGCEPGAYALLRELALGRNTNASSLDAPPGADTLLGAILELIAALSDECPLLIVIDDAQWIHRSFRAFCGAVVRRAAARRVSWLFSCRALRESDAATWSDTIELQRVALRGLDVVSAKALVKVLLVGGRERELDGERLLNSCGGHPLFLVEGARRMRSRAEATSVIEAIADDYVSRLPDGAAHTLLTLAALGGAARVESLAAAAQLARPELAAAIGELERSGIVREDHGELRAYTLWSNAALARLGDTERRLLEEHASERAGNVIPFASAARAASVRERRSRYAIAFNEGGVTAIRRPSTRP